LWIYQPFFVIWDWDMIHIDAVSLFSQGDVNNTLSHAKLWNVIRYGIYVTLSKAVKKYAADYPLPLRDRDDSSDKDSDTDDWQEEIEENETTCLVWLQAYNPPPKELDELRHCSQYPSGELMQLLLTMQSIRFDNPLPPTLAEIFAQDPEWAEHLAHPFWDLLETRSDWGFWGFMLHLLYPLSNAPSFVKHLCAAVKRKVENYVYVRL